MMLSLLKTAKSVSMKGIPSPRHAAAAKRMNQSEAREYAHNVKAGNIVGVDPAIVDDCQVCQKLLAEMMNGNGAYLQQHVDNHEDASKDKLMTYWMLKHNGPGHLKATSIEC